VGDPAAKSYGTGAPLHAKATLHPITIPKDGQAVLGFWLWQEVADQGCAFDTLRVLVGGKVVLQVCGSTGGWKAKTVDLSAYAGKTIVVTFDFDTVDATNNEAEGAYIDDVYVLDSVGSGGSCCNDSATCSGGALCTNPGGVCLGGLTP
jgi:bacillopeptidase F (M6 metalloprotease family)